jgi:hypothetical protein
LESFAMADNPSSAVLRQIQPSAPSPEDEPYFAALGRFIAAYANAEAQVHILARRLTKLNDAKARIVFSGMRIGDLADRIRGLFRVADASTKRYSEIDGCLRQLDLIGTQRNNLVHRFVNYQKGGIIATNIVTSKSISTHEFDTFTIADPENMDSDCTAITLRLAFSRRKMKPEIKTWVNAPWRYKPPLPAPKPKSLSSTPRSRKRRPPSSRG